MTKILTCTECGEGTLHPATWEAVFGKGDDAVRVIGLECYRCDSCGADPVFADQIRRNQLKIADAKRARAGLLSGDQIRRAREEMGLTQANAAEIFGGGPNAFSKYERGEVLQSEAMDRLIRLANWLPDALEFLKIEAGLAKPAARGGYSESIEVRVSGERLRPSLGFPRTQVVQLGSYQAQARR